jgi:hypothetical protein
MSISSSSTGADCYTSDTAVHETPGYTSPAARVQKRYSAVKTLTAADVDEIYQLRALLEGEAIFHSLENMDPETIQQFMKLPVIPPLQLGFRSATQQLMHQLCPGKRFFRNRGAVVKTLTAADVDEIYQLRALLEGEAIFHKLLYRFSHWDTADRKLAGQVALHKPVAISQCPLVDWYNRIPFMNDVKRAK